MINIIIGILVIIGVLYFLNIEFFITCQPGQVELIDESPPPKTNKNPPPPSTKKITGCGPPGAVIFANTVYPICTSGPLKGLSPSFVKPKEIKEKGSEGKPKELKKFKHNTLWC
jgi:hypothetical protein